MRSLAVLATLTASALLIGNAAAEQTITMPDAYLIGKAPAKAAQTSSGLEKAQASTCGDTDPNQACLDGAFYAEVFPIFNGEGGNISFLRLGTVNASTFHVTVLGYPSGDLYGQADIAVPAHASPQYAFSSAGGSPNILGLTNAGALANNDTGYSVYLTNPDTTSFYQHVIFNGGNSFFEDMTICPSGASIEGTKTLTNIDTSLLAGWPATIYIHNTVAEDATYRVDVRNSHDGSLLGSIASLTVPANSTYSTPFSWFEQQINLHPVAGQEQAILEFHATGTFLTDLGAGSDPVDVGGIFGQGIYNQQFTATINMSNKCSVNR
jgi:hypothetical protein